MAAVSRSHFCNNHTHSRTHDTQHLTTIMMNDKRTNNKPFLQSFNSFLSFFSYLSMESLFCSFSSPSPLCSCPILPFFKSAQKHMIFCYPRFIRRQNLPLNHATSYTSLEVSLARVKILLG